MASEMAKRIATEFRKPHTACLEDCIDAELAPLLAVVEAAKAYRERGGHLLWELLTVALDALAHTKQSGPQRGCYKCSFHGVVRHSHEGGSCPELCDCVWARIEKLEQKGVE